MRIALELGRENVLSTAVIPLAAAAAAWAMTRAHPKLREWSALAIWCGLLVAVTAVLARHFWPIYSVAVRGMAGRGLAHKLALGGLGIFGAVLLAALAWAIWRRRDSRLLSGLTGRRTLAVGTALGLVLLGGLELAHRWARSTATPTGPNVVLISVDTLRADFLSCYGHPTRTSPRLDLLAKSGLRFANALSQSPWTMPSMATVHTSLYPSRHRATGARSRLGRGADTLAEVMRNAGYRTLGVVSHDFVDGRHGFAQGFVEFDESHVLGHEAVSSDLVSQTALEILGRRPPEPFFLWVHYFDPHFTYIRHPQVGFTETEHPVLGPEVDFDALRSLAESGGVTDADLEYIRAVYGEEIAFTDEWIGKLLEGVRRVASDRPTVFILTADHGEYFMERQRFGHGRDVYQELVHVPLIIGGDLDPELRGKVVDETVETASIAATVLGLAGLASEPMRGPDLLRLARGQVEAAPCFTEGSYAWGDDDRKLAAAFNGWKLIRRFDDRGLELYNTRSDSGERVDLVESTEQEVVVVRDWLLDHLDRMETELHGPSLDPGGADQSLKLSDDEIKRLRSLGYVE